MNESDSEKTTTLLEKHVQTIMVFVVTCLIAWVGTNISNQQTQIALLQQTVSEMKDEMRDFTRSPRFTRDDFKIEMRLYENRLTIQETQTQKMLERLNDTDKRLRVLERKAAE